MESANQSPAALQASIKGYSYSDAAVSCAHEYLLQRIEQILPQLNVSPKRVFDLGCGNGSVANWLVLRGYEVKGVDPSDTGIAEANKAFPSIDLRVGSAYDPHSATFGQFPLVISLEVVEHVYAPRDYAACVRDLLQPGGYAIVSTPYHGYLKNLGLAVTGRLDKHFTALWDHGHIEFWSVKTLSQLFGECGLMVKAVHRVGRVPWFSKSMILVLQRKPV